MQNLWGVEHTLSAVLVGVEQCPDIVIRVFYPGALMGIHEKHFRMLLHLHSHKSVP